MHIDIKYHMHVHVYWCKSQFNLILNGWQAHMYVRMYVHITVNTKLLCTFVKITFVWLSKYIITYTIMVTYLDVFHYYSKLILMKC